MVLHGQGGYIRAKVVVIGKKLLYLGKIGCIGAERLYSNKSGCILAKVVLFGQRWLYSGVVVEV